ncbi:MAG: hypothetical protein ACYC6N_25430 [Pirellulaceae bacterium]
MRRIQFALVVTTLLLLATTVARGQHSMRRLSADCECGLCAQCGTETCSPPLLTSITQGVHHVLGSVFCCPGLNARHDIYRAALHRNDFGKCNLWFLPIYSCRKCPCGPGAPPCPHCGPGHVEGEEIIDMQSFPDGMPVESAPAGEPTPAVEPGAPPLPDQMVPGPEARGRQPSRGRPVTGRAVPARAAKQASSGTSRDRVARSEPNNDPRSLRETTTKKPANATNLIQRTSLFQVFQSSDK